MRGGCSPTTRSPGSCPLTLTLTTRSLAVLSAFLFSLSRPSHALALLTRRDPAPTAGQSLQDSPSSSRSSLALALGLSLALVAALVLVVGGTAMSSSSSGRRRVRDFFRKVLFPSSFVWRAVLTKGEASSAFLVERTTAGTAGTGRVDSHASRTLSTPAAHARLSLVLLDQPARDADAAVAPPAERSDGRRQADHESAAREAPAPAEEEEADAESGGLAALVRPRSPFSLLLARECEY